MTANAIRFEQSVLDPWQQTLLRFVLGESSLDGWDDFVSTVKSNGIDTCIDLYQAAYERYLAR